MNETTILDVLESIESNIHGLTTIAVSTLVLLAATFIYVVEQYYKK
ncbi:MAG: hypothetical protein IKU30_01005 [Clostridia bacterium]|nr:hypothetical protein [Clostridia bacterium]